MNNSKVYAVSSLEAARQASLEGQHQKAVDLCASVLRQKPGDALGIAYLALTLWRASAHVQAVELLPHALSHFPAQDELSLALLDSCLALGQGERALKFAATLPEALLAKPAFRSRIEDRLVALLNAGDFGQGEKELLPLMQAQPEWAFGDTLQLSILFNCGGRGLPPHPLEVRGTAEETGRAWRSEIAKAMSDYRGAILQRVQRALKLTPRDDSLLEIQTRVRFEEGRSLSPAELLQTRQRLGCELKGPFPLRNRFESDEGIAVELLQPSQLSTIPAPRFAGRALELGGSIGPVLTIARYAADSRNATVCAGSDVVLLDSGEAWCDSLAHPLGEFTGWFSDSWIALGSVHRLLLRDVPVTGLHGAAISLMGGATRFYGHWLLDYLVRLRAFEHHPEVASCQILVEDDMPASHYEALHLLLGPQAALRPVARGHGIHVDRLLFSGPDVFFPHATRIGAPTIPSVAPASLPGMVYLRRRMLAALSGSLAPRGGRLFLRRRSATRRVQNEDALCDMLVRDWGFEELQPETLSFADQVRRFHAAEVIVGAQGSAMSNCVFCAPGTLVVSLCSPFAANFPSWADALEQMGIRHCFVVGEPLEGSHPLLIQRDVRIEANVLRDALSELAVLPKAG